MEHLGDTTDDTTATTPAPASPTRPDRVIGGVAGLIGGRLGLDPLWVRLGFVVLGLAGGIGVVVYGAWWLVLIGGSWSRPLRWLGGAALLALVPLLVADGPDSFVTGPIAVVLLLAGLALALWQPRRDEAPPSFAGFPPPAIGGAAPTSSATAATATAAPLGEDDPLWQTLADGWNPPAAERTGRFGAWRRRERSVLGRLTLGVAVWLGAAWALADQLDGGRLHPEQWFGAAAVVCGAGLLVGVVRGRARWLIVPAVLAAGTGYVGGTMSRLAIPIGDLAGDRYVSVGAWSGRTDYRERVGVGQINIDIGSPIPTPSYVEARVGLGSIHVAVPSDVTVEIRPHLDHGTVFVPGRPATGEPAQSLTIGDGATPDVVVDAWIGRGDLHVAVYETSDYPPGVPVPPTTIAAGTALVPDVVIPDEAGALIPVRDGIAMTGDGWIVLGNGEALISPTDEVTTSAGGLYPPEVSAGDPQMPLDPGTSIDTGWGQYRLLPRSLLVTPDGQVIDLQGLRAEVADAVATTGRGEPDGPPASTTAAPGVTTTLAPQADANIPATTTPGG